MMLNRIKKNKGETILEMKDIHIDGFSDERWHKII